MTRLIVLLLFLTMTICGAAYAAEATPNDVYAQAVRIQQEVELFKRHYQLTGKIEAQALQNVTWKPEYAWVRGYIILLKLGKFRRIHDLPYIEPPGIEPVLEMSPNQLWEMTQRILSEINILKYFLDVPGQAPAQLRVSGKKPIDVYNKLTEVSLMLDLLNGATTPGEVYSEAMRINDEVNQLLRHLGIFEHAVPPARRVNLQPGDALQAIFALLGEIQRIQRAYGILPMEFKVYNKGENTVSDEVLMMVELAVTEFQRIKFHVGMTRNITPPSIYTEHKQPDDVVLLLGYITDKLQEIKYLQ